MNISAGNFRLRFPLDLSLSDVSALEASGDTMATLGSMTVSVKLLPLLKGDISVSAAKATNVFYALGNPDSAMMLRARIRDFSLDAAGMNLLTNNIDLEKAEVNGADVTILFNDSITSYLPHAHDAGN